MLRESLFFISATGRPVSLQQAMKKRRPHRKLVIGMIIMRLMAVASAMIEIKRKLEIYHKKNNHRQRLPFEDIFEEFNDTN